MPNTQFDKITIDDEGNVTASGPYNPGLVNTGNSHWQLVGKPVVVFMVVKNEGGTPGEPESGNPDLVVDGVGYYDAGSDSWSGTIDFVAGSAAEDMAPDDVVRAVGAAIQIKTDTNQPKNPPVVEVITWCVPQRLSRPDASTADPVTA